MPTSFSLTYSSMLGQGRHVFMLSVVFCSWQQSPFCKHCRQSHITYNPGNAKLTARMLPIILLAYGWPGASGLHSPCLLIVYRCPLPRAGLAKRLRSFSLFFASPPATLVYGESLAYTPIRNNIHCFTWLKAVLPAQTLVLSTM